MTRGADPRSIEHPYRMEQNEKIARRWRIQGRVQGVGFRYHVRTNATALGVTGWIRGSPDGLITVHGEGDEAQLASFETRILGSPTYAAATIVERESVAVENCTSFEFI